MADINEVRVALPLIDGAVSYFAVTGDKFEDGYTVTVNGDAFKDVACSTAYVHGADQDYLIVKWVGKNPTTHPGTGEVDVTITVKDAQKKDFATKTVAVVQVVGSLPPLTWVEVKDEKKAEKAQK